MIDWTAFVQDGSQVRKYMAVVQAIITLAHNLGIRVTAEGIESSHQAAVMIMMDCDYAQGFLFSKPLSSDDAAALVASGGLSREYTLDLKKSA